MIGRVTNRQVSLTFIDQINRSRTQIEDTREQIASGIRVANPSDDPGRAGSIAQMQSTLARIDRHKQRIDYATGLLDHQEGTLGEAGNLIVRAKEIATQAANETLSPETREALAEEVFAIRDQLVGLANTKYQGRYIYGGADDDDAPFDAQTYTNGRYTGDPAAVRYVFDDEAGTAVTRTVEISDNDSVRVNSVGDRVFENSIASVERLGRALAGFRTTPENLSGLPDGGGVAFNFPAEYQEQTADIRETIDLLETSRQEVDTERSSVGARMNRLTQADEILDTLKANIDNARSTYQDADIFSAASNLATLQTSLQGLLASGSRIQDLSLLDYL